MKGSELNKRISDDRKSSKVRLGWLWVDSAPSLKRCQDAEQLAATRARFGSLHKLALSTNTTPKINMRDCCIAAETLSTAYFYSRWHWPDGAAGAHFCPWQRSGPPVFSCECLRSGPVKLG